MAETAEGRKSESREPAGLKLNQKVPDFELETYEPSRGDFGKFRMADQLANKRWTVLFFYPADFTFV